MCGIFGMIVPQRAALAPILVKQLIKQLFTYSESRGKEASGLAFSLSPTNDCLHVVKSAYSASKLMRDEKFSKLLSTCFQAKQPIEDHHFVIGHTRLVTNGSEFNYKNNQPVISGNTLLSHNGIIVNHEALWMKHSELKRTSELDSEIIAALIEKYRLQAMSAVDAVCHTFSELKGTASLAIAFSNLDLLILATNNGSLYYTEHKDDNGHPIYFTSERISLDRLSKTAIGKATISGCTIKHVAANTGVALNVVTGQITPFKLTAFQPAAMRANAQAVRARKRIEVLDIGYEQTKVVSAPPKATHTELAQLEAAFATITTNISGLKRCSTCVLPETVPFIEFDEQGECIFCKFYKKINLLGQPKLIEAVKPYRRAGDQPDCIMAFSGGRDSSYGLHYIVKELGLKPITYTYDWGMVTDLARRNISRMCSQLGVENIIISADIRTKRENIRKNVVAWLKRPHLGMVPLFMAGDKQFIWYSQRVKRENKIDLDIFTFNLLEKTQFKEEYSGIQLWQPGVDSDKYGEQLGLLSRVKLGCFYMHQFLSNPAYLNSSLFDTFNGYLAYYFAKPTFVPLFNYIPWTETAINSVLLNSYDWEIAEDADSTWRIGDGTAPFYNYIYFTMGGFSEHEFLRSNQIREGELDRATAMALLEKDNLPRWSGLQWYCDTIGIDFVEAISRINAVSKFYHTVKSFGKEVDNATN